MLLIACCLLHIITLLYMSTSGYNLRKRQAPGPVASHGSRLRDILTPPPAVSPIIPTRDDAAEPTGKYI